MGKERNGGGLKGSGCVGLGDTAAVAGAGATGQDRCEREALHRWVVGADSPTRARSK